MKWWFPYVLVACVCAETAGLIFISTAYLRSHRDTSRILGSSSAVVPIRKENLLFPMGSTYDQFYEPKPDTIQSDTAPHGTSSAEYHINADSLNSVRDYPSASSASYRVVVLGDSFTFGQYVDTADNWPSVFETRLRDTGCARFVNAEVINLGMSGYDLVFASYRYRLRGMKYSPDLIIWLINDHNFYSMPQLYKQRYDSLNAALTDEDRNTAETQGEYAPAWHQAMSEIQRTYDTARIIEQENAALYELDHVYHGPLVIIPNNVKQRYVALLRVFAAYRQSPTYLDIRELHLDDHPDFLFADGHPNVLGHRYIAEAAYTYIKDRDILRCGPDQRQ